MANCWPRGMISSDRIGGTGDPVCRYANRLEKIPGGHFLPEEQPDVVLGIIEDFFGA